MLVELDDCIHLLTSCYEKSLARSQWQSSSCFDAGKPWLKQWSRPRSTASAHRTVPKPPNPHLGCHEAPLWVTRGWLPTQAGYSSILNHIMQVVLNLVCTQGLMFPLKTHSKRMIHDDSDFTYCMTCSRISLLGRHPGLCSFISIHIKYVCIYVNMCVCVSSVFKNSLYIYMCVHINYLWYAFVLPWEKLTKAPSRKGLGLIQNLCEQQHLRCRLTHGRNPRFSVFQHPWIYIGFIIVSIYCFRIPWSETLFLFNVRNHEKSIKQYSKL